MSESPIRPGLMSRDDWRWLGELFVFGLMGGLMRYCDGAGLIEIGSKWMVAMMIGVTLVLTLGFAIMLNPFRMLRTDPGCWRLLVRLAVRAGLLLGLYFGMSFLLTGLRDKGRIHAVKAVGVENLQTLLDSAPVRKLMTDGGGQLKSAEAGEAVNGCAWGPPSAIQVTPDRLVITWGGGFGHWGIFITVKDPPEPGHDIRYTPVANKVWLWEETR